MYATRIWEQNINIIRMCDSVDTLFHPTFAFFFSPICSSMITILTLKTATIIQQI